jgi:hypothetical protein
LGHDSVTTLLYDILLPIQFNTNKISKAKTPYAALGGGD